MSRHAEQRVRRKTPGRPRSLSGPLDALIKRAGSVKALAKLLDVSDKTAHDWQARRSTPDDISFARIVRFCRKNSIEVPLF